MNTARRSTPSRRATAAVGAFTLIELIGVLAILTVLSAIVAPNVVRSIERAAVSAERESIKAIASQLKLYVSDEGALPTSSNWTTELGAYSDLSVSDLAINKRQMPRRFILDPASPSERVLVLSSMRTGLALPSNTQLQNNFQSIWDTADGVIPSTAGWGSWGSLANSAEYLVVERVNLRSELRIYTVTLNNVSGAGSGGGGSSGGGGGGIPQTSSYRILYADGTATAFTNLPSGATISLSLHTRDVIELYDTAGGGGSPAYIYTVSDSGRTFEFDGTYWRAR